MSNKEIIRIAQIFTIDDKAISRSLKLEDKVLSIQQESSQIIQDYDITLKNKNLYPIIEPYLGFINSGDNLAVILLDSTQFFENQNEQFYTQVCTFLLKSPDKRQKTPPKSPKSPPKTNERKLQIRIFGVFMEQYLDLLQTRMTFTKNTKVLQLKLINLKDIQRITLLRKDQFIGLFKQSQKNIHNFLQLQKSNRMNYFVEFHVSHRQKKSVLQISCLKLSKSDTQNTPQHFAQLSESFLNNNIEHTEQPASKVIENISKVLSRCNHMFIVNQLVDSIETLQKGIEQTEFLGSFRSQKQQYESQKPELYGSLPAFNTQQNKNEQDEVMKMFSRIQADFQRYLERPQSFQSGDVQNLKQSISNLIDKLTVTPMETDTLSRVYKHLQLMQNQLIQNEFHQSQKLYSTKDNRDISEKKYEKYDKTKQDFSLMMERCKKSSERIDSLCNQSLQDIKRRDRQINKSFNIDDEDKENKNLLNDPTINLKSKLATRKKQINELTEKINELQLINDDYQETYKQYKRRARDNKKQLKGTILKLKEEIKTIMENNENEKGKVRNIISEYQEQTQEIIKLQEEFEEYRVQSKNQMNQILEKEAQKFAQDAKEKQKIINKLENENNQYKKQNEELGEQVEHLQQNYQKMNIEKQNSRDQSFQKNADLLKENQNLFLRLTKLEEKEKEQNLKHIEQSSQLNLLTSQLKSVEFEKEQQKLKIANLTQQLRESKEILIRQDQKVDTSMEQAYSNINEEVRRLNQKLSNKKQKIQILKQQLKSAQHSAMKNEQSKEVIDNFQLNSKEIVLRQEKKIQQLEEILKLEKKSIAQLEGDLEITQKNIIKLQNDKTNLEEFLSELQNKYNQQQVEFKQLELILQEEQKKSREVRKLIDTSNEQTQNFRSQISQQEQSLKKLEKEKQTIQSELFQSKQLNESFKKQLQDSQTRFNELNLKYNKKIKSDSNFYEGSSSKRSSKPRKRSFYENPKLDNTDSDSSAGPQKTYRLDSSISDDY